MVVNTLSPPTPVQYAPAPVASKGAMAAAHNKKFLIGNIWVANFSTPAIANKMQDMNNYARRFQALGFDIFLNYTGDPKLITDPENPDNPDA